MRVGGRAQGLSACAPHAARRTRHAVREVLLCAPPAETESVRSLMGAQLNLILRGTARPGARSASVRRAPCEGWGGAGLAAGTGCADAGGGRFEAELHALPGVRREARRHRSGPSPVQADGRGRANRRRRQRRGGPWRVRHGQEPRAAMASRGGASMRCESGIWFCALWRWTPACACACAAAGASCQAVSHQYVTALHEWPSSAKIISENPRGSPPRRCVAASM